MTAPPSQGGTVPKPPLHSGVGLPFTKFQKLCEHFCASMNEGLGRWGMEEDFLGATDL